MKNSDPHKKKSALLLISWVIGLTIPVVLVWLWDNAPKYQAIRDLRDQGIEVTAQAVHDAVKSGDVANLALLKTAAAPFDTTDPQGLTPLMVAVEAKQEAALNLLLKHRKVDADARDKQGFTALSHALMTDQLEMAKSLIRHTKNPNVILANEGKPLPALLKTVQDQSQAKVEILLSHAKTQVNVKDETGRTPLHYAVQEANLALCAALLERKADPNIEAQDGMRPLNQALDQRSSDVVRLLLKHKAKIPETAQAAYLEKALANRDPEAIEALLAAGLDPNSKHPSSSIPFLEMAVSEMAHGCVSAFLNGGASVGKALNRAIHCGDHISAALLISHTVSQPGAPHLAPGMLEMALYGGNPENVDLLLENGADPNQMASLGQPVIALALALHRENAVEVLLEKGADANVELASPPSQEFLDLFKGDNKPLYYLKRDGAFTPLHLAALTAQERSVRSLLDHGADTRKFTSKFKRYPVAFAAERQNIPIMQMVLGRKAGDETRKVIISLKTQKATLYVEGKPTLTTSVSTGKKGYSTPPGNYVVTNKHQSWNSTIYGSSMPFFMRLNCSDFGLHSGSVPGYPASHGCIRVPYSTAKKLFNMMELGDPVIIQKGETAVADS